MGFVRVKALLGPYKQRAQEMEFLVDSGSFYTVLPSDLASSAGIVPTNLTAKGVLADKRAVEMPLGLAYLRLLDREAGVLVGIFDVPEPVLGVSTLESLGLKVDPTKGTIDLFLPWPLPL